MLRRRRRKRGWFEYVAIEDYRPSTPARLIAWAARGAWALRHPNLAAEMRRSMQWWKDIEQFSGPVYGPYDDFMGLQLTWARAESNWVTFGFQQEVRRPTAGVFISTWRKGLILQRIIAERANFPVRTTVFEAAVVFCPRKQADFLLRPSNDDALNKVQLKTLSAMAAPIPGISRRARVSEATDLGVLVMEMENQKTMLVIAARGLESDDLERLTRHVGIVQEHPGLLDKYRSDFSARQRALGIVVDY